MFGAPFFVCFVYFVVASLSCEAPESTANVTFTQPL
jgi:hypothetical protein